MPFSWFRLFKRTISYERSATRNYRTSCKFTPGLEHLEERVVPANYYTVSGFADGAGNVVTVGHSGTSDDPYVATTLRAAINAADANPGSTILLPGGTYNLTAGTDSTLGELPIIASMTLMPADTSAVKIVQQFAGDRVFDVDPFQLGTSNAAIVFTIDFTTNPGGLTITGGADSTSGSTKPGNGFNYNNLDPANAGQGGGGLYLSGSNDSVNLKNVIIAGDSTAGGNTTFATSVGGGGIGIAGSNDSLNLTNVSLGVNGNGNTSTSANGGGGGLFVSGSNDTVTLVSGDSVVSNSATGAGGGIEIVGTSDTLTSTGTTFGGTNASYANTSTTGSGGAIAVTSAGGLLTGAGATLNSTNDTFSNNTAPGASGNGGAIDFELSTNGKTNAITLKGDTFASNSAGNSGGAVLVGDSVPGTNEALTLSSTNDTFTNNTAGAEGGGLFAVATSITSSGDRFGLTNGTTGNTSGKFGGGLVAFGVNSGNTASIKGDDFESNSVTGGDGGGAALVGLVTVTGTTFNKNSASGDGGGFTFQPQHAADTLAVDQSTFSSNSVASATGGGGAIYLDGTYAAAASINVHDGYFSGNKTTNAGGGGGAIYNASSTTATIQYNLFTGSASGAGNSSSNGNDLYTNTGSSSTATENWWGVMNNGSQAPTATEVAGAGTSTTSPYIVLNYVADPNGSDIPPGQNPVVLQLPNAGGSAPTSTPVTATFDYDNTNTSIVAADGEKLPAFTTLATLSGTFANGNAGTVSSTSAAIGSAVTADAQTTYTPSEDLAFHGTATGFDNPTATVLGVQVASNNIRVNAAAYAITQPAFPNVNANAIDTSSNTVQYVSRMGDTCYMDWQVSTDGGMTWQDLTTPGRDSSGSFFAAVYNPSNQDDDSISFTANPNAANNSTSLQINTPAQASWNGYQFRVRLTDASAGPAGGLVGYSNAATLTVYSPAQVFLSANKSGNPVSQVINAGQTTIFSASATGDPAPSEQWQVSMNGGMSWVNINASGTTGNFTVNGVGYSIANTQTEPVTGQDGLSTALNITTAATYMMNGYLYQVAFLNTLAPSATTTPASLTVDYAPQITVEPTNQSAEPGGFVTFSAAAAGGNPTYTSVQWMVSTDGGATFSNLTPSNVYGGVTTPLLSITNPTFAMNGYKYMAVFSNSANLSATTTAATLMLDLSPTVVSNPSNATVGNGGSVVFNATANVGYPTASVQWQVSSNGGASWSNLSDGGNYSGSLTDNLTISSASMAMNGNEYRAFFSNTSGTATTTAAQLLVQSAYAYTGYVYGYYTYYYAYYAYSTGAETYSAYVAAYNSYLYAYYAYYYNSIGETANSQYYAYYAYYYGYVASYDAYVSYTQTGNTYAYDSYYFGYYDWVYSYNTANGG